MCETSIQTGSWLCLAVPSLFACLAVRVASWTLFGCFLPLLSAAAAFSLKLNSHHTDQFVCKVGKKLLPLLLPLCLRALSDRLGGKSNLFSCAKAAADLIRVCACLACVYSTVRTLYVSSSPLSNPTRSLAHTHTQTTRQLSKDSSEIVPKKECEQKKQG